jgi:Putative esterase
MTRLVVAFLVLLALLPVRGGAWWFGRIGELDRLNRTLAGQVLDFTDNHGRDRRFDSPALGEKKGVYVYLPPGYDGVKKFPVMLWLHGANQDEKNFLTLAPHFDAAVRSGALPPLVIVAPDGSLRKRLSLVRTGSFFRGLHHPRCVAVGAAHVRRAAGAGRPRDRRGQHGRRGGVQPGVQAQRVV